MKMIQKNYFLLLNNAEYQKLDERKVPNRQIQMVAALIYCNDVYDIVTLQQPLP